MYLQLSAVKPEELKKNGSEGSNLVDKAKICRNTVWGVILHGCETWVSDIKLNYNKRCYKIYN